MRKVGITETILRDGHQSLIATRMTTEEMLPIIEEMDKVGYYSLECFGGATFDVCLRYLKEDPWERLRKIKSKAKNTKLQMLLRGQNLLGYKHYADDIVKNFVKKCISNGVDVISIFDALNDYRNIETALETCKKEGGIAQATICYTTSPVHTIDKFVEDAKRLENMGADSICIKDMAGLLLPYTAYELISKIKQNVDIPISLHTHYTSGVGDMTYLKAIEAGVDIVDTALSPLALGTSQPATESIVATIKESEFDAGIDMDRLNSISQYFEKIRDKYIENKTLDTKVLGINPNILTYQVPGGMLSNLVSQLKEQNAIEKYEEVLKEIPKVRAEMGYPPLVTPTSQIVGTQAVLNVIMGERYKMITKETKGLVKGEYGRTPQEISKEIKTKIIGGEDAITVRPADLIRDEYYTVKDEMIEYLEQEEDVLSYAMFPTIAKEFLNIDKLENIK